MEIKHIKPKKLANYLFNDMIHDFGEEYEEYYKNIVWKFMKNINYECNKNDIAKNKINMDEFKSSEFVFDKKSIYVFDSNQKFNEDFEQLKLNYVHLLPLQAEFNQDNDIKFKSRVNPHSDSYVLDNITFYFISGVQKSHLLKITQKDKQVKKINILTETENVDQMMRIKNCSGGEIKTNIVFNVITQHNKLEFINIFKHDATEKFKTLVAKLEKIEQQNIDGINNNVKDEKQRQLLINKYISNMLKCNISSELVTTNKPAMSLYNYRKSMCSMILTTVIGKTLSDLTILITCHKLLKINKENIIMKNAYATIQDILLCKDDVINVKWPKFKKILSEIGIYKNQLGAINQGSKKITKEDLMSKERRLELLNLDTTKSSVFNNYVKEFIHARFYGRSFENLYLVTNDTYMAYYAVKHFGLKVIYKKMIYFK